MNFKHKLAAISYTYLAVLGVVFFSLNQIDPSTTKLHPLGDSFSVLSATSEEKNEDYYVYGFLPYWTLHKAKYIQLDKVTDIAFFALHIESDGRIRKIDSSGIIDPGYNQWKNNKELDKLIEKAKQQDVRVALTIISHEDDTSDAFLDCRQCWYTLLDEIIVELDSKNLRDINLDFEYYGYTDPDKAIKYTQLTQFLNEQLDRIYGESFVVVSAFADSVNRPRVTEIPGLSNAADAIFIMAYDFHRPASANAGPVAPINGAGIFHEYDISTMLRDYAAVAPRSKLILGVPYYGYNWVVYDSSPYANRRIGNDYIGFSQSQTYENVMDTILKYRPAVNWDDSAKVPYFTYISSQTGSIRQVYFENAESLSHKYNLAKDFRLGGVGIWALGYDGGYQELWSELHRQFYVD